MNSIKNHQNFEKMVRSFTSKDDYRHNIMKPICYSNGWVASTNAHKLIWFNDPEFVNKDDVLNYEKGQGANAFSVINKYSDIYEGGVTPVGRINFDDIKSVISEIRKEPEYEDKYKDCSNCDGIGTVECGCCGHESDCEDCNGEGTVVCGKEETGFYKYPSGHYINIGDNYFSFSEFEEIIEYFNLVDINELDVYITNDSMKSFFGVPNERIYLLLMGVYSYQDDIEKKYEINYIQNEKNN